jgi:ferritin
MLSKTVQDALNNQIAMEFQSSYVYLSMSAYFEHENLPGFARWMRIQSGEEHVHAMKIFDFVNDRAGQVHLQAIPQPPVTFGSPLDTMQVALEHEQKVTASIHNLYGLAAKEGDYAAQVMLQWFVNEQVEEEKTATAIVEQLKRIGNDGPALLILDRELGARLAEAGGESGAGPT